MDSMTTLASYGVLILPLLSFLLTGLWLGRKNWIASACTATFLMGLTFVLAVILALGYRTQILLHPELYPSATSVAWEHSWMTFGPGLAAHIGFYLDPISVMMVVVISFISFLVHFYSIGYMKGDKSAGHFFPLLSFFSFSMLGLVVSTNLIQTFFFWELVGAASYLLIGFWYTKPSAVAASKKAFIVTRFADAFFLMGMLVVGTQSGGFDFLHVNDPAAAVILNRSVGTGMFAFNLLSVSTVLIYLGAWGKSAMFPLHVWLPDAMEGPTPVSSLIHSATMVVAGIYLTARLFPLFAAAEGTLRVVEFTGAFTALFAALIACTQTDLKRILAFSTLSQLGLMMLSLGLGGSSEGGAVQTLAYTASMFHVFTHAFFKSLLFLSAGIVIHAIHSNDIRDAGGMRKSLSWTYAATLIACLAIAGIWPFSGFFSKEEILQSALKGGHYIALAAGLLTSVLTAFYMSRYFILIFHGTKRSHASEHGHDAHEGILMVLPVLILAVPSALIGWLGKDFFLAHILPYTAGASAAGISESHESGSFSWLVPVTSILIMSAIGAGWYFYGRKKWSAGFSEGQEPGWYRVLRNKFYVDEFYGFLVRKVAARFVATPANWTERKIINGAFDETSGVFRRLAIRLCKFQNGQVQVYLSVALLGLYALYWIGRMVH